MKKLHVAILFFFFMASAPVFAQYGYGYGYPYGSGSMGGVDRRIDTQRNAPRTKSKKAKEEAKKDMVEMTMDYLTKRLKLDSFQKAAITNIYNEHKAEIMLIAGEDSPIAVKKEKMKEVTDKIDAKITPLLGKDQLEEYNKMIAEREK